MSKAIQDLLQLVKLLREEVAHQTNEINHLRRLIENCAGCRETTPIIKENCDTFNPCYDGVHCYNTPNGVKCGQCPRGSTFFVRVMHITFICYYIEIAYMSYVGVDSNKSSFERFQSGIC